MHNNFKAGNLRESSNVVSGDKDFSEERLYMDSDI
jgi:hypothetical protein